MWWWWWWGVPVMVFGFGDEVRGKWQRAFWFPVLTNMRTCVNSCRKPTGSINEGWLFSPSITPSSFIFSQFFCKHLEIVHIFCFSHTLFSNYYWNNSPSFHAVHIAENTWSFTLGRDEKEYLTNSISCNCCERQSAKKGLWYSVEQTSASHPRNMI